ncbi:GNAT family N-acetyltransferase [Streptomyces bambusae]|uniref:GNAT family N-acetyltransferase n=1 Tax=Streptomyces bambusae TaxID=1550616 RepID=UPI001CFC4A8D|nr:GNAT family N-acetyltransferase [Streptomyces bambusae]MCB5166859.1 GNAT family N-acetyltransferase [Streptomyces bambusae]
MIRNAGPADLDEIAALHSRARATYYRDRIPAEAYHGQTEAIRSREAWAHTIERGDGSVLCAELLGRVAGVAAFRVVDGEMTLTQLHVDPDHWRRGIGAELHAVCVEIWSRCGVVRARLEVYAHNRRAQDFYAAQGWRPAGSEARTGSHRTLWLAVPPPRE